MKAKSIEKLLTGVMKNFLETITDDKVTKILKEKSYITGGCIPSMLMDEFVNDYDIYLYYTEDANIVRKYFESKRKNSGTCISEKQVKYEIKLITDNAINLSDKIQIITKFVGDPVFVTERFDWQHIKSWYDCNTCKLHLTSDVYQLVCEKELIYTGSDYPLSSLMRLKKYIKKGWNVSNSTILHIALDFVASINKMEAKRQFEQAKHGMDQLQKLREEFENMSQEEFDELDKEVTYIQSDDNFEIITDSETLHFIDKAVKKDKEQTFNVEDIIYHLNGVDPITIQAELNEKAGQYLTIAQILELIKQG